ncbi:MULTISPECIES: hypothetical protein [unclassified Psychrobacter]|uniref:hypothetical protein n=1 Tax=unclassified Psychrobacter TaxID=196806 RepID=UPI000EEC3EAC|nr:MULTISPECIES: hypothetical protein [unclassified Psychrobacter]MBE8610502.1 hypothetical protein [Pseudomonas lundensis]HCI76688.1 hypothetical protein [Psychrobacter sp.]
MTQEFSSLITPINDSEIAPKAVQQTLFWVAVGVYSLLLLIGSVQPIIGIIGLLLLGVAALFKIIIRNFQVIGILLLLGIAATAVPFLLIIYIPVLLYFFIKRLGYLFQHFGLVMAGLFIYFFPIGLMVNGASESTPAIGVIIPIALFPIILKSFVDNRGYTVQKALEIMSEAPILIISIVLPFLKLNIGADFAEGVGSGEAVAGEAAAAAKPMPNDVAFMKESPIYKGAFSTEVSVSEPVATTAMLTANSAITVNGFFQQLQNSQQIQYEDGTSSAINNNLNQIRIGDSSLENLYIQNDGASLKITDSQGDTVGFIKQNGASLKVTDVNHFNMGSITPDQNGFNITDSFGKSVASISESSTSLDAFTTESIIDIDAQLDSINNTNITSVEVDALTSEQNSSQLPNDTGINIAQGELAADTLDNEANEANEEVINRHQLLAVALLSLIANKNRISNTSDKRINVSKRINASKDMIKAQMQAGRSQQYGDDSFYAYIQKNASDDFKNNERVYTHDKIKDNAKFSPESMKAIEDKFELSNEKILLIFDDAFIFTGTNGMVLTEDHIYLRAMLWETQSFLIDEVTSLNTQGILSNEAKFNNGRLSYRFQEQPLRVAYKELIQLFKDYKNSR